jgi:cytosine/adenosine deaminase-related metal-dependent hydrolase
MEPSEERTLGRCQCHVSFNSCIAARRGLSPRVSDMESYGCNIAMGSDNMSEDMIEVARTGLFMERVRREDGRDPAPEDVLRWAGANGYRAIEAAGGGTLEAGKKADLIIVDLSGANMIPVLRAAACFVHQGMPANVEGVMVDGRWLMRDGVIKTLDEARVAREAQAICEKAWRNLFDTRPGLPKPPAMFWESHAAGA